MSRRRANRTESNRFFFSKRKVFVGGLSSDTKLGTRANGEVTLTFRRSFVRLEHLRDYFSNFGAVESATVKYDKSGRSKGFGFVLFEDPSVPEKVRQLHSSPRRSFVRSFVGLRARSSHHSRQTRRYEIGASTRSGLGS